MATIKDIANRTGLSASTISRVLNYDETLSITNEKKQLILEVAQQLEYEIPRNRKNGRSKKKKNNILKIGLLHALTLDQEIVDPYYISMRMGIEKKLLKKNIQVIKYYHDQLLLEHIDFTELDGVIIIGNFSEYELKFISENNKNLVFVDSNPNEDKFDCVVVDIIRVIEKTITYLIDLGYKKIGYLGGDDNRIKHFQNILEGFNLYNGNYVFTDNLNPDGGSRGMLKALELNDLPEVFLTASDSVAIGALKTLYKKGIRVPDQLSIIGLNDIPTSKYTSPPLSTVRIESQFMGECSVELLLEQIAGREIPKKLIIPSKIIIRETLTKIY